jgi:hypothetical protein
LSVIAQQLITIRDAKAAKVGEDKDNFLYNMLYLVINIYV